MSRCRAITIVLGMVALLPSLGCATTSKSPSNSERVSRGYVYYLDGAGGGGITNWGRGVRDGLRDAGYDGAGEMYTWQTGLGVVADQTVSNRYKRDKARKLVNKILEYKRDQPGAPVTLMGLSAGTAITAFTLEALPASTQIDTVILLSGSLSASHDLTAALKRVRGKMYITTSQRDMVLGGLMPFAGTADRGADTTDTIGVQGPQLPTGASAQTRELYNSKLVVIPWKQEFARYGNSGKHTDTVKAPFVAHYIAPLISTRSESQFAAAPIKTTTSVPNPDYARWENFKPGSWVLMEGEQTIDGVTKPVRLKVTLMQKNEHQLVFKRQPVSIDGKAAHSPFDQTVYESALISPTEHPTTHPEAQIRSRGAQSIQVGSRNIKCEARQIFVRAEFSDWGGNPEATVFTSREVPGGLVAADIKTTFDNRSVKIKGRLIDFYARR